MKEPGPHFKSFGEEIFIAFLCIFDFLVLSIMAILTGENQAMLSSSVSRKRENWFGKITRHLVIERNSY